MGRNRLLYLWGTVPSLLGDYNQDVIEYQRLCSDDSFCTVVCVLHDSSGMFDFSSKMMSMLKNRLVLASKVPQPLLSTAKTGPKGERKDENVRWYVQGGSFIYSGFRLLIMSSFSNDFFRKIFTQPAHT